MRRLSVERMNGLCTFYGTGLVFQQGSRRTKTLASPQIAFPSISLVKILIFLLLPGTISSQSQNNMTTEYSTGREITEAVIRRILRSQIFPEDYSFLFRLAYVESRFGEIKTTFREGYYGGIWQVDKEKFFLTRNPSDLLHPVHEKIEKHFNISWTSVKWEELVKPFHSGLAARLYFMTANDSVPDTITRQAHLWKLHYRTATGEEEVFSQDSKILQDQSIGGCRGKIDLCIALDASSSVTVTKFGTAKDFIASLIQSFDSSLTFTRIGMFVYSNKPYHTFYVENSLNPPKMASLAQSVSYPYGDTRTDLALMYGMQLLKNVTDIRKGVPQVIFLLTDGQSSVPIDESAKILAENGIKTVVVGVGSEVNHTELITIGMGEKRNVFNVSAYETLSDSLLRLSSVFCEMPQMTIPYGQNYIDGLTRGGRRYYVVEIRNEKGVTVFVDVKFGVVNAFWAYEEEMPCEAVHDGAIDGITFIPAEVVGVGRGKGQRNSIATGFGLMVDHETVLVKTAFVTVEGKEDYCDYEIYILEGNHDDGGEHGFNSAEKRKSSFFNNMLLALVLLSNVLYIYIQ